MNYHQAIEARLKQSAASPAARNEVHGRRPVALRGPCVLFTLCLLVFPCGGATCARRRPLAEFTPPIVFPEPPTLAQLIERMNRVQTIERLNSGMVSLSTPDAPIELSGNLSWHRPTDFRLQAFPAGSRILGDAIDAGSNAEKFWLLTRLPGEPATLYFASHQAFEMQPGPRRILPVSPLWIREALGVLEFDPNGHHEGPIDMGDGKVAIRSIISTPRGSYKRVAIIEPTRCTLRQLILYDPEMKMVAVAQQSEHQYYSAIDASLPHRVDLSLQPADGPVMAFTIKIGSYVINETSGNEALRYAMPESVGFQAIDLVEANARIDQSASQPPARPPYTANTYNPIQNLR